jgi:hypothetical protein
VLNDHKPTFVCVAGATPLGLLCPFTISKRTGASEISKWRGSTLQSPLLLWPHYIIPSFHPAFLFRAWDERQNAVLCLAKLAEEFNYWRLHSGQLQPLPQRQLISDPPADDAIDFLHRVLQSPSGTIVSIDIENTGVYRGLPCQPRILGCPIHQLFIDCEYRSISNLTVSWCDIEAHERR